VVAALLIVLGCVLAPLAGVAVWARNQVTNTDRYVATVAPLANDPAIQAAIADQLQALSSPIANGIQGFTRTQVAKIVQSQAFADAWVQASWSRPSPARGAGRSRSRTTP
jgi:hypothetical protein